MYAKIMIFCTKSARKIAEFQACIKLGKFYILMLHLPSGPMLGKGAFINTLVGGLGKVEGGPKKF